MSADSPSFLKILLHGARGRMGQTIARLAPEEQAQVVAAVDLGDDPRAGLAACQVVIDFSHHSATRAIVELAAAQGRPIVIGTTGHAPEERAAIEAWASRIPLVWSGNYSLGVNLLLHLVERAAATLPAAYQAELVEIHHRHKIDAPSGTAQNLLEAVARGRPSAGPLRHGRAGVVGARPTAEIGVHAVRGGDVVGEHTVYFLGEGERLELTHRATDRAIFARGALHAARWVAGRAPGLYRMKDVLGL